MSKQYNYETEPGCFLMSTAGSSRSGDLIVDMVSQICREADEQDRFYRAAAHPDRNVSAKVESAAVALREPSDQ